MERRWTWFFARSWNLQRDDYTAHRSDNFRRKCSRRNAREKHGRVSARTSPWCKPVRDLRSSTRHREETRVIISRRITGVSRGRAGCQKGVGLGARDTLTSSRRNVASRRTQFTGNVPAREHHKALYSDMTRWPGATGSISTRRISIRPLSLV